MTSFNVNSNAIYLNNVCLGTVQDSLLEQIKEKIRKDKRPYLGQLINLFGCMLSLVWKTIKAIPIMIVWITIAAFYLDETQGLTELLGNWDAQKAVIVGKNLLEFACCLSLLGVTLKETVTGKLFGLEDIFQVYRDKMLKEHFKETSTGSLYIVNCNEI